MKDFFSSVEKNTVDFIDAEKESKKEKKKKTEGYQKAFRAVGSKFKNIFKKEE